MMMAPKTRVDEKGANMGKVIVQASMYYQPETLPDRPSKPD
jgi:hypothetical protein